MKFSELVQELVVKEQEKGELKALAGLDPNETMNVAAARDVGREVAQMTDEERRTRFLNMIKALGGYYTGRNRETQLKLTDLRTAALEAYNEERGEIEN
jgi:uncharacterized protein YjgD (DUF1641 family)